MIRIRRNVVISVGAVIRRNAVAVHVCSAIATIAIASQCTHAFLQRHKRLHLVVDHERCCIEQTVSRLCTAHLRSDAENMLDLLLIAQALLLLLEMGHVLSQIIRKVWFGEFDLFVRCPLCWW